MDSGSSWRVNKRRKVPFPLSLKKQGNSRFAEVHDGGEQCFAFFSGFGNQTSENVFVYYMLPGIFEELIWDIDGSIGCFCFFQTVNTTRVCRLFGKKPKRIEIAMVNGRHEAMLCWFSSGALVEGLIFWLIVFLRKPCYGFWILLKS